MSAERAPPAAGKRSPESPHTPLPPPQPKTSSEAPPGPAPAAPAAATAAAGAAGAAAGGAAWRASDGTVLLDAEAEAVHSGNTCAVHGVAAAAGAGVAERVVGIAVRAAGHAVPAREGTKVVGALPVARAELAVVVPSSRRCRHSPRRRRAPRRARSRCRRCRRGLECARRQAARRRRAHPQQQVQPPQEPPQAKAQRLGRLCRRADAAGGARHRAGGRPARGHHRRFHTPLARPAAATCLGQLHLGPAPTAALWKLLLRVVPPLGPAPPRRQRASFPLHALGASDARPDPVTVAVKAVTGQRVNDMVTTRSKAKHEAPQGAAAPQGAPLPHALTSCTARREPGRAVRFSPSRHRPPTTV